MRFLGKLTHPFALVVEGFLVGAILFGASTPNLSGTHAPPTRPLDSSVIPNASR
jgi:hypothetical protein